MKNIQLFFLLFAFSFSSLSSANSNTLDSIPKGAVPFEYDSKLKKSILISGTLNDSIPLKYWLETGAKMGFSDSLSSVLEKKQKTHRPMKVQKPMKVQIGNWKQIYGDSIDAFYIDNNSFIFEWFCSDLALLPWTFFDKKNIEISFSKQYIRELTNTPYLSGYDSVKIFVENGLIKVPVAVTIQGKEIKEFVLMDTGSNGDVVFNNHIVSKYNIKSDSAYFGKSRGANGSNAGFSFPADTIKIGKNFVTEGHYVAFSLGSGNYPFSGLIGNKFFENFDIVLDLKNYYLYLKPIEKQ
jgi:predicted aspartyl protease